MQDNYMMKSILNWLDLISTEKKHGKERWLIDDCTFSVVYSLLKIKSKAYIYIYIYTYIYLKFPEISSKHVFVWV